ncbi:MAG: acyl-homoserine-lactone synthase [Paracoccus sp. (in: a-proteobacteria)]|uniref:acyl-homoserine-lactone synthase n=1 Tax=Paracoccus sp. TaxID=267 RepID=UPI0026DF09C4|nr:acyl-homoserine-lactone synthase [Paracoccus sp. (in: a-proteobacteria)]MDO5620719.1 acyl-homoserine-lactone synthase [Paracoccus sp. (in: a-proteobacteria)]
METTTLSFANLHNHGELFANVFRARKQSFIVQKNWDLPEAEGMEFDQYDTPQSRWVAIHELGQVLGGLRLTPTTARCGIYSYMIRDAQLGILGGSIPQDLLYGPAPVDPHIWECTRVFVNHAVPMAQRRKVHFRMAEAMVATAREQGATRLVALTAGNWERWYGRCGVEAEAIGPMLTIDDGQFQCVSISLAGKMH